MFSGPEMGIVSMVKPCAFQCWAWVPKSQGKGGGNVALHHSSDHRVELIVRDNCGSCVRVREQIMPVLVAAGVHLVVSNVDEDPALKVEFGDRVPVVLVDDEEFASWEVDNDELAHALL